MKGHSNYLHRRGLFSASQMLKQEERQPYLVPGAFPLLSVLVGGGEVAPYFRISDSSIHNTMSQPREDDRAK